MLAASFVEADMELDIQHNRGAQRFEVEVEGVGILRNPAVAG